MEEIYAQNQCTNNTSTAQTPRVGGVALDQAATFLADMTEYTGAYYDDVNKRIVFIGRTNTSSPQFEKDDLAVAIKTLFFDNIIPAVSLEPHATDSSKMAVRFTGNLEDTKFGQTLLDADWKLKQYIHGYDENNNPVVSSVPSYKSVLERYIDLGPGTTGNSSRWWIVPNLVSLKKDDSTDSFVFDDVQMEVLTEPTSESNLPNWDQAAEDFADNLTTHYDDYADETPEFFKVKQLAKIVAVIKWLKDTGIESNMLWAKEYEPKFEATPRTMPRLTTPSLDGGNGHLYSLSGGIQYDTSNTYDSDDGNAAGLKTSSEAVHAPKESTHWKFSKDSITYDAVAVSADSFKSYGSYNTNVTDMSFPIAGDLNLAFVRSYSSFSGGQHKIGRGWSFLPASLVDNMPVAGGALRASCEGDLNTHRYKLAFQNQDLFETYTYNCNIDSGSYVPDEKNYHSIMVDTFPSSTETQYSVKLKNQTEYIFQEFFDDPLESTSYSMRLSKIKDKAGNEINYTYESSRSAKLTRISDENDHYIDLTYNDNGLISKITDWTAREVNYEYDDQGNLITVIDPNGEETHYSYNDNNKLDTIENREGDNILINTYLATSSAKLATQTDVGGLTTTYSYHETNRTIVATDSASPSRSHTTKYDSKARMLEDIDPYGNKFTYTYATESAPLTIRDKNNNLTTNTYDANGNITSVTFPDSKQTLYTYNDKNEVTKITDGRYGIAPKITQYTYDGDGNLTQASESGKITTYTYNGAGELLTLTNPLSKTTTWTRDTFGNPLTEIDPLSKSKIFEYDELGRLIKTTDAENKFQTFTYDNNSNLLVSTDSAGITTKEYTKENLLKKITLPDGTNTQFTYNDAGSLHSVNGALSSATTYDYDQYQN